MKKVTERNVFRRAKRAMLHEGEQLRRSNRVGELGRYYSIHNSTNAVWLKDLDLELVARELGVLHENEEMVPED